MSIASSSCRIDWRPSRRLCLALLALGGLGTLGVLLSGLPLWKRGLLAPAALGYGAWLAWREWRRPPCALELDADGSALMHADTLALPVASPRLRLRGSLASLHWRGGSLVWCADTLPAPLRRQLLLRLGGRNPA